MLGIFRCCKVIISHWQRRTLCEGALDCRGASSSGRTAAVKGVQRAPRIQRGRADVRVSPPAKVSPMHPVPVACEAPSDELLLVEWLNALIYEMAVRAMVFGEFSVEIDEGRLRATAYGEAVDVERHEPAVEIKGATLTALQVVQGADGWRAQCVVDV